MMGNGARQANATAASLLAGLALLLATTGNSLAMDLVELRVSGIERVARVFPGRTADREPSPLVLVFHGLGDSERDFARAVEFEDAWPEATVVYPRGRPRPERQGMLGWQGGWGSTDDQDMAFVDSLLDELPRRYHMDPEQIYATGFSNGGQMTFNLLLDRPCRFAAFAPVGALAEHISRADLPRPVIFLYGRYEPREYTEAWQRTVVALARLNRSTGQKREWAPGFTEFVAGPDGATTVYSLYGAGHIWPSRGNEAIVRFFQQHTRGESCAGNAPEPDADRE